MSDQPTFKHFGRYLLTRELGHGAMGVVYEAEDESLQRKLAIKTMLLSDDGEERVQQEARFRQEAKAAASLNHPNIITIYELGREGNWLYIAMELVTGVELRDLMGQGRLPLRTAVELAAQIASGLAAAHARGVVHRDIKPSNIMVLPKNHAKIMDFGIARMQVSEVKTQAGMMLGSPKYMAPEQVEGQVVDPRSDIFSLGSVLYEMVAGVPPFQGSDLGTLLFDIVRAAPPPPSRWNPEIPQALDAVLAKAMRKDPAERYQDASHFSDALAQCASSLPTTTSGSESLRSGPTEQFLDLTLHEATQPINSDAPFEQTLPHEPHSADWPSVGAPADGGRPAIYPLSRHFDSSAAIERIVQRTNAGAPGRTYAVTRDRTPWHRLRLLAYVVAVAAAIWLAVS